MATEDYFDDAEIKNVFGGYTDDRHPEFEIIELEDFKVRRCPFCGELMSVKVIGVDLNTRFVTYTLGCANINCFAPGFNVVVAKDCIEDMEYPEDLLRWNRSTASVAPVRYMFRKAHRGTVAFDEAEDKFKMFKEYVKHLNSIPVKD